MPATEHLFRLILVLVFSAIVVNWEIITKDQGTYKKYTGQKYPHPTHISGFFSYFESNGFFCSWLVNMVSLGILLRDRGQTMEIRMKKMIENLRYQKCISVAKR